MDFEAKERLINLVRENECIYNRKHKDFKNTSYKIELWDNIAAELNVEAHEAKQMWRSLRDSYTRHRKQVKSGGKYIHYKWSAHMTFLDPTLDSSTIEPESPNDTLSPESPALHPEPGSSNIHTKSPIVSFSNSALKRRDPASEEEYLTKKKREDDGIDYLFKSYAETFKKFPLRKQAELKVVLAKMFAEAELSELENNSSVEQDTAAPVFYFSTDKVSEDGIKNEDDFLIFK